MYKIVYAQENYMPDAVDEVEQKVNELKKEGWTEQGGVSISCELRGFCYVSQAMVKKD